LEAAPERRERVWIMTVSVLDAWAGVVNGMITPTAQRPP